MRRLLSAAALLPAVMLLAGCGAGPRGGAVFVPVVQGPADSVWPFALPPTDAEPKDAKKDGPQIQVVARFVAGHPSDLKTLGIDCDKPLSVLAGPEHTKRLGELLKSRRIQIVTAPRITILPGRLASIAAATTYHFVGDYQRKKAEPPREPGFAPVPQDILDGIAFAVRAELEGEKITFAAIAPRMANALGMRDCKSWFKANKEVSLLLWQEPVFLTAEGGLPDGGVPYTPGTTLAIPLRHTLRDTRAKVRGHLDCPVEELNAGSLKFLKRLDKRGYPLPGRLVVLVTARVVTPKEGDAEPPKP